MEEIPGKNQSIASTIEIFVCYAREDGEFRRRLEKQLRVFQREELIRIWNDSNISPGEDWEQQVHAHLNTAQIILLLVSPDFVDSDYCYSVEMTAALKRHAEGDARVVPIIIRPVHWHGGPLGKLQALPTDGKPIASTSWHSPDDAFHDVAEGVRKVIGEFLCIQWLKRGKDYLWEQQNEEALAAFTKAISLAPHYEAAYQIQGDTFYNLGRYQDALLSYEQVHSTESSVIFKRGQCLFRLRQYENALAVYDKLLRLSEQDALAHAYRGYALLLLKRYDDALIACEQARRLDSSNALIYYLHCLIQIHFGKKILLIEWATDTDHGDYDALTFLAKGDVLFSQKQYDQALATYAKAQRLAPNDPWIYERLGDASQHQAQYEEALSAYEEAIHRDAGNAELYHKKGFVLEQLTQQAYATARERGYRSKSLLDSGADFPSSQILLSLTMLDSFAVLPPYEGQTTYPLSVAISPNGQFAASANSGGEISVWDLQAKTLIGFASVMDTGKSNPFLAFNLNSSIIIAGASEGDVSFSLWNPYIVGFLGVFEQQSYDQDGLCGAFSPDHKTFIGAYRTGYGPWGPRISKWHLHNRINITNRTDYNFDDDRFSKGYRGHEGETTCLAYNSDGTIFASGGLVGDIRIWDAHTMHASLTVTGHKKAIRCLGFVEQTLLSGSDDTTIKVWDIHTGKLLHTLEGHSSPVKNLVTSSDGQILLSTGKDASICLWDLHQGTLLRTIGLPQEKLPGIISTATFTSDRRLFIASIDDKTVKIWSSR